VFSPLIAGPASWTHHYLLLLLFQSTFLSSPISCAAFSSPRHVLHCYPSALIASQDRRGADDGHNLINLSRAPAAVAVIVNMCSHQNESFSHDDFRSCPPLAPTFRSESSANKRRRRSTRPLGFFIKMVARRMRDYCLILLLFRSLTSSCRPAIVPVFG